MRLFDFLLLIVINLLYILDTNSVFYVHSLIFLQSVVCLLALFSYPMGSKVRKSLANFFFYFLEQFEFKMGNGKYHF